MSPDALEFHDGRISAVAMPAPGIVTISFSYLCAYFRTETPGVFDVKRAQAKIVVTGATRLETELAVNVALEVSDGTITIDGATITPRRAERFTGACRLSLELAGPFIGKLIVEGSGLEIRVHAIGQTFEQFHGAID
ncbi:MAG: hypothetical protein JNM69_17080 [Archangium sp.]|nr:hypothetical protein [Archangium sp.]